MLPALAILSSFAGLVAINNIRKARAEEAELSAFWAIVNKEWVPDE